LKEYILEITYKGYSHETVKTQGWNIGAFVKFMGEATPIDDVSKSDIKRYITHLQDRLKANTINQHILNLRAFFKFLVAEDLMDKDPMTDIELQKVAKDVIKTYSKGDVQDFIGIFKGKDYLSVRNKTIILLLVATGIRNSELCNIKLEDISDDSIRILGKGNKVRYVPIPLEFKRQLLRYMRAREKYVNDRVKELFVTKNRKPLTRTRLHHLIADVGEYMGLDVKATVHHFRRYYAQQMLKNTDLYTVSRLLGHSDIKTTQIYVQGIADEEIVARGMNSPLGNLMR
jgi:integrase/recombinase XerD